MTKGTAWVTGASAGLGVAFAEQLAARGHDLILTARRAERLEALAATLRERHRVEVDVLPADLAEADSVGWLIEEIGRRGLAVNLLVNNAGFGLSGAFAGQDRATLARMITLNCGALTELCHAVLPGMIQMRRGGILNVASTAAFQPGPGMAVYYATKAYVLSLSEALHEEVRRHGVKVAALCPGPTATEFFDAAGMGGDMLLKRFAAPADQVVADGIAALDSNRAVKVSGLMNATVAASVRFTPRWLVRRVAAAIQRSR